jgi:tetratricopeptide (TPR) repeat protein
MPITSGTRLGPYEVIAQLGAGGLGEVYRARDERLGRELAIKVLPDRVAQDPSAVARFRREARAASALNHPTIVTVYEIAECDHGWFIAMELVAGETLRTVLKRRVPADTMLRLGAQVACAIGVAHGARIIHGDLKPENIMVRPDGYVKVLDFGLARLIAPGRNVAPESTSHIPGRVAGSVRYMSPEHASGEPLGMASDVFSLGIVLYEGLTGRHPFDAPTELATLAAIVAEAIRPASQLNAELAPSVDWLLARTLAKDPAQRPAAEEVAACLEEIIATTKVPVETDRPRAEPGRVIVGHERERGMLRTAFADVSGGAGLLVSIAGEPGVGKTTLVNEFLAEVGGSRQAWSATGRCSERVAGTEALLPLLEALDGVTSDHSGAGVAARLLESWAPTWRTLVAPTSAEVAGPLPSLSQARLKRELCVFVQALSRMRPVVLFFDDVHWADPSTIDMIGYLAGRFDSMRVLIVATYRPAELQLASHPFHALKLELEAKGLCRNVEQTFLTRNDVEQYLALSFVNNKFPRSLAAVIHERTEGNALFMSHLVRYLHARGVVARDGETWVLTRDPSALVGELPESVRSLIRRKIDRIEPDDRALLLVASIQGVEFEAAVVAKSVGKDVGHVEDRLEALERLHAIVRRGPEVTLPDGTVTDRYQIVHVLYQNALYGLLTPARRATLSSAVAHALMELYGARHFDIAAKLAQLFEDAREFRLSTEYLLVAASQAQRLLAAREAATLARHGIDLLSWLPEGSTRNSLELRLQLTLAVALTWLHSPTVSEVGAAYYRALELARELGDDDHHLQALRGLCTCHDLRGDIVLARQFGEQTVALGERLRVDVMRAVGWLTVGSAQQHAGEHRSALAAFEQSIAASAPWPAHYRGGIGTDPCTVATAMACRALCILGYLDQGLTRSDQVVLSQRGGGDWRTLSYALLLVARVRVLRRESAETLQLTQEVLEIARDHDVARDVTEATAGALRGWALSDQGRPGGSDEITRNLDRLSEIKVFRSRPEFAALLAEAYLREGRSSDGLELLEREIGCAAQRGAHMYDAELHRLWAELLLARSGTSPIEADLNRAESSLERAITIARAQEAKLFELRARTALSRLWMGQGRSPDAGLQLAELLGWFTEGLATADLLDARAAIDLWPRSAIHAST